ncbi:MAG: lamin tail domain-containing protein [Spirochaetales bacterium]|nr:lamin tail domain-containing protein [Spirochaetales bacterium]
MAFLRNAFSLVLGRIVFTKARLVMMTAALGALPACYWQNEDPTDYLAQLLNANNPYMTTRTSVVGDNASAIEGLLIDNTMFPARETLYCVFYDVSLPRVLDGLFYAHLRGVDVRVGLDEDNLDGIGYRALKEYIHTSTSAPGGRKLWLGNSGAGQVYLNTCIADGQRVWVSTAAPTVQDLYSKSAFGMYFQTDIYGLATKFATELDLITHGAFGSAKQRLNRRNHWLVGNVDVGVYMAPSDNPFEGFTTVRTGQAEKSVYIYTTEWLSNEIDSNCAQEALDLGYEVANSKAADRRVVASWTAFMNPGVSTGSCSTSQTEYNNVTYVADRGVTRTVMPGDWAGMGLNMIIRDYGHSTRMAFVSSYPFGKRADSSHDGITLVFEAEQMLDQLLGFYRALEGRAGGVPSVTGDTMPAAGGREVVVSELNYAGSYDTDKDSGAYEYIEFFNNSGSAVNLSGWVFSCRTTASPVMVSKFTFPARTMIGPGQYLVVKDDATSSDNKVVTLAHLVVDLGGSNRIDDNLTDQCQLADPGGQVVDTIGQAGTAFASRPDQMGRNDKLSGWMRTMERTGLSADGTDLNNWHPNTHTSYQQNQNIGIAFLDGVYGTPGYANSSPGVPPTSSNPYRGALVINEIGFSGATGTDFVELFNKSGQTIDLTGMELQLDSGCSISTGGITRTAKLSGSIPAGGYFLVAGDNTFALSTFDLATAGSITSSYCVFLTTNGIVGTAATDSHIIDWVSMSGTTLENSSQAPNGGPGISRCPNGQDTDMNGTDFINLAVSPRAANGCP